MTRGLAGYVMALLVAASFFAVTLYLGGRIREDQERIRSLEHEAEHLLAVANGAREFVASSANGGDQ